MKKYGPRERAKLEDADIEDDDESSEKRTSRGGSRYRTRAIVKQRECLHAADGSSRV